MKRIVGLILALMLVLSLFACNKAKDASDQTEAIETIAQAETVAPDQQDNEDSNSDSIRESLREGGAESDEKPVDFDKEKANKGEVDEGEADQGESNEGEYNQEDYNKEGFNEGESNEEEPDGEDNDGENTGETEQDPANDGIMGLDQPTEESTEPEKKTDWIDSFLAKKGKTYFVVSLIVVILLLAIIALLLFKRKSNKNIDEPEAVNTYSVLPQQQTIPENPINEYVPTMTNNPVQSGPVRAVNVHNIGRRKNQEDSFGVSDLNNRELCSKKGAMAVVADGMGGLKGGENVSSLAVLTMLQGFSDMQYCQTGGEELDRLLDNTVREVNKYLEETVGLKKSGSTLMSVIIQGGNLSWITVGDSRATLFRDGKLTDLNRRHVFAMELDEMVRNNKITASQAMNHPDREKLTSYIGMGKLKYVDRSARPMPLVKGDKVVLMSDGVFNTLSDPEIERILSLPMDVISVQLENAVLQKANPHQDNFTAVVLEYLG